MLLLLAGTASGDWIDRPDPTFGSCASTGATSNELCWKIERLGVDPETCVALPGGQRELRAVFTPPLCVEFQVIARSHFGNDALEATSFTRYTISPDLNGDGLVSITDYRLLWTSGMWLRYGLDGLRCLNKHSGTWIKNRFREPAPGPLAPKGTLNCGAAAQPGSGPWVYAVFQIPDNGRNGFVHGSEWNDSCLRGVGVRLMEVE